MTDVSARDGERHIVTVTDITDAFPRPFGWLVDDSLTFRPWFLGNDGTAETHAFVDAKRAAGKRITTLWTDGDHAVRMEAYRLGAARLTEAAYRMLEEAKTKAPESVPEFSAY